MAVKKATSKKAKGSQKTSAATKSNTTKKKIAQAVKAKNVVKKVVKKVAKKAVTKAIKAKSVTTKKKPQKEQLLMQPPRGMRDILPEDQLYWVHIDRILCKSIQEFGFRRIMTPIVEYANLFERGIGEVTDIIEKEMYTFTSRGGDRLALRPEMTAGIVRSFIQNGMHVWPKPIKLYSSGPLFRYDRPQEGRYRQHYQANFDIYGESDPILDAQLIQMAHRILTTLGLKNIQFQLNSLGTQDDKKAYQKLLVAYLRSRKPKLCKDCKRRLDVNPLRVLDCKEEKCQQIVCGAPQAVDHLSPEAHDHFKNLLEYLDELDVPYQINPTLVRGLDYYTQTIFEIWSGGDDGGRMSLGGGGRYDNLVAQLGGADTPAIGFGLGLDRIALQMKKEHTKVYEEPKPRVFLAQLGELAKKKSLRLFVQMEKNGILVAESFGRGSLKAQLRQASKIRAEVTVILGQKEALDDTVIVKDMASGSQETVPQAGLVDLVKKLLKNSVVVNKKV